ncbi:MULTISPECIES: hypothetical protein [Myxococcus]|uniref:hypothetical protein n=1 Tax=Myxococcus TaxID=32 RepID=UPI001164FB1B|nr:MULTISPECIES: hypothetical protein [Myxococcus]QDF07571.1 hypothetical protein BHS04_30870 [Myxococcus xanthus]WAM25185.1 hypothetical protein OZ403_32390 [Myxococcus sp. NMCA1]
MLLSGVDNDSLSTANALLQKFNSYSHVKSLQPFVDVAGYEKKLAELLNPFGEWVSEPASTQETG